MFETLPEGFEINEIRALPEDSEICGTVSDEKYYYLNPEIENCDTIANERRKYIKLYSNLLKWAESLPQRETLSKSA